MAVTLTESAATEVKRLIEGEKLGDDTCLRMAIGGGGCSGLQYGLGFDQEYDPDVDAKYDFHGVALVTKKKFALHLDGTTIDFQDGPWAGASRSRIPTSPRAAAAPAAAGTKNLSENHTPRLPRAETTCTCDSSRIGTKRP